MNKPIMYIDMDQTIVDFKTSFLKNKTNEKPYPQSEYGFFIELPPIVHAINSIKILEKYFDVWILSRPSVHNLLCYTEKAYWCRKHLGFDLQKKLILCTDKSLLKGDYLIDDSITDGQERFEGRLIRFGSEEFPDWIETLKYILDNK